jgi:Kelch motif
MTVQLSRFLAPRQRGLFSALTAFVLAATLAAGIAGCGGAEQQVKSAAGGERTDTHNTIRVKPGRWVGLPGMPVPRFGLAAATGPDGRLYAIGGALDGITRRVDVYDPAVGGWTRAADLRTPRTNLAAAVGRDSRIYALGGATSPRAQGPVATVEAYSGSTGQWEEVASMPTARAGLAAVRGADGRIYAIGGRDATGRSLRTLEIYDAETDTWTRGPDMEIPRVFLAAAADAAGRIYAFGGSPRIFATRTVEVYEPESDRWIRGVPLPLPRIFHAATTGLNGEVYVLAGEVRGPEWITNEVLIFSPDEQVWRDGPRLLHERIEPAATTGADGTIYVFGGCNDPLCNGPATVEALKPDAEK